MENLSKYLIGQNVVITTKSRRWLIMHGELEAVSGDTVRLKNARCCVYYSADTRSHVGLATDGPADGSRVTTAVDLCVVDGVETITSATEAATKRWNQGEW